MFNTCSKSDRPIYICISTFLRVTVGKAFRRCWVGVGYVAMWPCGHVAMWPQVGSSWPHVAMWPCGHVASRWPQVGSSWPHVDLKLASCWLKLALCWLKLAQVGFMLAQVGLMLAPWRQVGAAGT